MAGLAWVVIFYFFLTSPEPVSSCTYLLKDCVILTYILVIYLHASLISGIRLSVMFIAPALQAVS